MDNKMTRVESIKTFKELKFYSETKVESTYNRIEDTPDGFKLQVFNKKKEYVGAIYFCKDKTIWLCNGFALRRTIPQMVQLINSLVEK